MYALAARRLTTFRLPTFQPQVLNVPKFTRPMPISSLIDLNPSRLMNLTFTFENNMLADLCEELTEDDKDIEGLKEGMRPE